MVALLYPIPIVPSITIIMVEQNCVYERTMTVVYERNMPSEEEDKSYTKLREMVNRKLYTNHIPVVNRYHMTEESYSELNRNEYMPHTKEEKTVAYQIFNDSIMIYSNKYAFNRSEAYDLLSQYSLSCGVEHDEFTDRVRQVNEDITTTKEVWPSLEYVKILPYIFVDGKKSSLLDVRVNRYANNITIYTDISGFDKIKLDTTFYLNKDNAELEFNVKWHAPVKSTKADIENHLVGIPEVVLATVMNLVESILTDSGWDIDEDKTTIDCVTQSNINTKAECSPAVISSLRKAKAEL